VGAGLALALLVPSLFCLFWTRLQGEGARRAGYPVAPRPRGDRRRTRAVGRGGAAALRTVIGGVAIT
jgi:hypothetical protein